MTKQPKITLKEEFLTKFIIGGRVDDALKEEIWNFFEPYLKLKTSKPKIEIPEENLITFNDIFPQRKGGSGKSLRCNLKELRKAFEWFLKEYPNYSWHEIYQAAAKY